MASCARSIRCILVMSVAWMLAAADVPNGRLDALHDSVRTACRLKEPGPRGIMRYYVSSLYSGRTSYVITRTPSGRWQRTGLNSGECKVSQEPLTEVDTNNLTRILADFSLTFPTRPKPQEPDPHCWSVLELGSGDERRHLLLDHCDDPDIVEALHLVGFQ